MTLTTQEAQFFGSNLQQAKLEKVMVELDNIKKQS